MSEDTRQSEPQNDPQEKLRLRYRRLLTIAFVALIVSGIWCLIPFWKSYLFRLFGFYWLFVAENGPVLFCILLFLLGGIGVFCFGHFFITPHPEEPRQKLMSLNELRDLIGLLGVAIGLAMIFRLGMRTLLLDFFAMENIGSVTTDTHVYHLSFFDTGAFSDGVPYGLIECDRLDVVCKAIEVIVMRGGGDDLEQPTLTYDSLSGKLFISASDYDWGRHPSLRYDEVTHMLYVEGDNQTYYSYQLEE